MNPDISVIAQSQVILVIDDTPEIVELLGGILGNDYQIISANNGRDGIELAIAENPDLILLDIIMPDLDGYEVCKRLKKNTHTAHIPVIFVTAMDEMKDEARGLEAGAIDYITKPINMPIVRARVKNHMELKKNRDMLEIISTIDGLTGIPNRRQFDRVLAKEWRRATRYCHAISIIIIDIDYFKAYNDRYGHLQGDDCLKTVAKEMEASLSRPADFIARYGGEEFACILPDTDSEGAFVIAGKLRTSIENLKIPHPYSATSGFVTISLGVASIIPSAGLESEKLILNADKYLYYAKHNGRNQIGH